MNIQSYERITERIVGLLEQGTVPWHKPWQVKTGFPRNLVSRKPYRGINVFLLMTMSYESPHWLTFRQARQLGGSVKKGEKSCPVVFWKQLQIANTQSEEPNRIPLLRLYHVFNLMQCEGLAVAPEEILMPPTKPAEILANMPNPPAIKRGMTAAFYSPADDYIGMPERDRFDTEDGYHATLFHELVHSTGHGSRLKRKSMTERNRFGLDPYCKEELVAELGCAFLCGHAGILDRTLGASAAYIQGWLKQLKHDRTLTVSAGAQAQKAADYILGTTYSESEVSNE